MDSNVHIVVEEHRNWNTKKIYYGEHLVMTYRRCPKKIWFKSKMVNDLNQNLCGGWAYHDLSKTVVKQLLGSRKPFGELYFLDKDDAIDNAIKLEDAGLNVTKVKKNAYADGFGFLACQPITVGDIGSLEDLKRDYDNIVDPDSIDLFDARPLHSFFKGWDQPEIPLFLTGLILGYPIENTISLYLQ